MPSSVAAKEPDLQFSIPLDADPFSAVKARDRADPNVVIGSAAGTPPLSDQQLLADIIPWQLHQNVTANLTANLTADHATGGHAL